MSGKRYTQEFRDEAVRQVTERGHSVASVAERLGVTAHSLYRWVAAARPAAEEQSADDLREANAEIKRLGRELRRTREERDILKKAAAASTGQGNTPFQSLRRTRETQGLPRPLVQLLRDEIQIHL